MTNQLYASDTIWRYGGYYRLSDDDDKNLDMSNSIKNQEKRIKNHLNNDNSAIFIKDYIDDGYTGTNLVRY